VKTIKRLRLLVTLGLWVCAAIAAYATGTHQVNQDQGVVLTLLFTAFGLVSTELERWLQRREIDVVEHDEQEVVRVKLLADRARADVLGQVRRTWVRPELTGTLYEKAPIELHLVDRPAAVEHPVRELQRRREPDADVLSSARSIGDVFERAGNQLLLVGKAGAGKTTLLMELAEELLIEAEQRDSRAMPIVFQLAAWLVEEQSLSDWLVAELHKRYGVPTRLGMNWVESDQIIPLLDGLDEVADRHRDSCVSAINSFHDDHGIQPLVVTCRVAEYDALSAKLQLRAAVEILPLDMPEVNRYLREAGPDVSGLRAAVRDDRELAAMLTEPLSLSMAVAAYAGRSAASVRSSGTPAERRQSLLGDYVEMLLNRSRPVLSASEPYSRTQIFEWLGWLARTMLAYGESLFYLDWVQPNFLPNPRHHRLPPAGAALVAAVLAGLLVGLLPQLLGQQPLLNRTVVFLAFALPVGLVVGWLTYSPAIEPTDALRWSRAAMRRSLSIWTLRGAEAFGLVSGLLGGILFGLLASSQLSFGKALLFGLIAAVLFAVPAAAISGLLLVLAGGLQPSGYVVRPGPGIAIRRSRRNGLISGALAGVVVAIVFGLVIWLVIWLSAALLVGLKNGSFFSPTDMIVTGFVGPMPVRFAFGLAAGVALGVPVGAVAGLVVGFQRGGGAYLRHLITRWLLIADGVTPRDYPGFLEYIRRLGLMRLRNGCYEFVHPLVLEYFATAPRAPLAAEGSARSGATSASKEGVKAEPRS
jgi:eukaryotic-like serine/threonine-protein kinase